MTQSLPTPTPPMPPSGDAAAPRTGDRVSEPGTTGPDDPARVLGPIPCRDGSVPDEADGIACLLLAGGPCVPEFRRLPPGSVVLRHGHGTPPTVVTHEGRTYELKGARIATYVYDYVECCPVPLGAEAAPPASAAPADGNVYAAGNESTNGPITGWTVHWISRARYYPGQFYEHRDRSFLRTLGHTFEDARSLAEANPTPTPELFPDLRAERNDPNAWRPVSIFEDHDGGFSLRVWRDARSQT